MRFSTSMFKVAILVDLELSPKSGGHVKFWENICYSIENQKDCSITFFFLGKKAKTIQVSKNITIKIFKPIISSKILRFIGIDADYTDLNFLNPRLFFLLKKFDIIHSTDQLYCMARTAKLASKAWKIPLTSSYHTDAPSYSKFYVTKIFKKLPFLINNLIINKFKMPEKVEISIKKKIKKYFNSCEYAMINNSVKLHNLKIKKIGSCNFSDLIRGTNTKIFKRKKVNKSIFLKKYKIPSTTKIIFFCGRIHELKGALFLSKIQKFLMQEKKINVSTVLAGEDLEGEKCKSICSSQLHIIGHISQKDIASFFNLCDLFVFPSIYETGPQVVLEAKACNTVCVVSPNGGGKRIKRSGYDGVVVKDLTLQNWVNVTSDLLLNPIKIKKIKNNLQKDFDPISWEKVYRDCFLNKWKIIIRKRNE